MPNLNELEPISYQLLRVRVRTETLCDIRLELRHNAEGPSRWRIVDVEWEDELSCAGRWASTRQRPKNLNHYRFETPEAALEVWNRGVSSPPIVAKLEMNSEYDYLFKERFADALKQIKVVCWDDKR